jgi:hypothetical protein
MVYMKLPVQTVELMMELPPVILFEFYWITRTTSLLRYLLTLSPD